MNGNRRRTNLVECAMRAEMLDRETEADLARAWRDRKDEAALHRLINAYMRLAISMAARFRHYGAPMNDLVQEAGLGLMKAADKFDPDRGVRFSTYAVWWIRAAIQDYVMRNWSLVRTGSTSSQKTLFFSLRRVQARIERDAENAGMELDQHQIRQMVSAEVGVSLADVEMMSARMTGSDFSLNATQSTDDEGREWIDTLADSSTGAEERMERASDLARMHQVLGAALRQLGAREQLIIKARKMADKPRTLADLGEELGISKERVRQLESVALDKMRDRLRSETPEIEEIFS